MDNFPFGIISLEGSGLYREEDPWNGLLYRPLKESGLRPINLKMIPYFAWANRGASSMSVWLPLILER